MLKLLYDLITYDLCELICGWEDLFNSWTEVEKSLNLDLGMDVNLMISFYAYD